MDAPGHLPRPAGRSVARRAEPHGIAGRPRSDVAGWPGGADPGKSRSPFFICRSHADQPAQVAATGTQLLHGEAKAGSLTVPVGELRVVMSPRAHEARRRLTEDLGALTIRSARLPKRCRAFRFGNLPPIGRDVSFQRFREKGMSWSVPSLGTMLGGARGRRQPIALRWSVRRLLGAAPHNKFQATFESPFSGICRSSRARSRRAAAQREITALTTP